MGLSKSSAICFVQQVERIKSLKLSILFKLPYLFCFEYRNKLSPITISWTLAVQHNIKYPVSPVPHTASFMLDMRALCSCCQKKKIKEAVGRLAVAFDSVFYSQTCQLLLIEVAF